VFWKFETVTQFWVRMWRCFRKQNCGTMEKS